MLGYYTIKTCNASQTTYRRTAPVKEVPEGLTKDNATTTPTEQASYRTSQWSQDSSLNGPLANPQAITTINKQAS